MFRVLQALMMIFLASCATGKKTGGLPERRMNGVFHHPAQPPPGGTQKWNPVWWLGNADDPVPPEWYRPGQKMRDPLWQLRNPLHNFTFYVIGVHDRDFVRHGRAPGKVFHPEGGWNWAVIRRGCFCLPFVSYEGRHVRWYALWREKGNFGLKLHRIRRE